MKVASCANSLEYACGCKAVYQLIGIFASQKEWHIIPCNEHAGCREAIVKQADIDWERITSEVRV